MHLFFTALRKLCAALVVNPEQSERDALEAYLADSQSIVDLENRQRQWEAMRVQRGQMGLFPRG